MFFFFFFFFKQKTAYEMRISDWSSDVCSSDLSKARRSIAPPRIGTEIAAAGEPSRISVRGLGPGNSLNDNAGKLFQSRARRSEERRVGKELSVRVDLGGRRIIKKKLHRTRHDDSTMYKYYEE